MAFCLPLVHLALLAINPISYSPDTSMFCPTFLKDLITSRSWHHLSKVSQMCLRIQIFHIPRRPRLFPRFLVACHRNSRILSAMPLKLRNPKALPNSRPRG